MFPREVYIRRRQQLKERVGSGIILLLGNEESSMSYKDNWYSFRQDSSFLYFFGLDRPGLAGIIDVDNGAEIICGDDVSVEEIVWVGTQVSLQEQAEKSGINTIRAQKAIELILKSAQEQGRQIHFLPPYRPENILKLSAWLGIAPAAVNSTSSVTLIKAIVALRSIKSAEEVSEIEKAINVTADMQLTAIRATRQGMTEAQVAGMLHEVVISSGGNLAFPLILTVNGQILHNHYGSTILGEGQMVLCDCGAESAMHYAGDLTRTFPVDTRFTNQQREIYEIVLGAHRAAADKLEPGKLYRDIHLWACEKLAEGLKQVGLMKGDIKEAVAQGAHALFFPCGLGHMLGLDTHDMEDLGEEYVGYTDDIKKSTQFGLKSLRLARALEPGFVLTVEPGLYFIPELIDLWAANKKFEQFINYDKLSAYRSFGGIRIEEDFLITAQGSRLLGKDLPKTIEGIEAFREQR